MQKKCGEYDCEEDFITYDDIEVNNCVAYKNFHCMNCENIKTYLKDPNNKKHFTENPIKKLYNLDETPEKNKELLESIKNICKIQFDNEPQKFILIEPDYKQLEYDYTQILKKLELYKFENKIQKYVNADNFINSLYLVAKSPDTLSQILTQYDDPESFYKRWIKDLLEKQQCSSRLTHEVTELPINIQVLFNNLLKINDKKFDKFIEFLETKPQACLEGVIEIIISKFIEKKKKSKSNKNNSSKNNSSSNTEKNRKTKKK